VLKALQKAIGDSRMTVVLTDNRGPVGVPLIPTMSTGATDGIFLQAVGIPTYGPPGL
jgi:hypothetical protein